MRSFSLLLAATALLSAEVAAQDAPREAAQSERRDEAAIVVLGSKAFTESIVLGEIAQQLARLSGAQASHRRALGGTRILFEALERGDIHAYPEYTGTLLQELLPGTPPEALEEQLSARGLAVTPPLGFNNTYAIGMKPELASRLGIRTLSELRAHPELQLGFGNEFMNRADGWPALKARYRLPHTNVRGLDHDLAYQALDADQIAATDLYATDAEIQAYGLVLLEDDLGHFPAYDAVILYRAALEARAPEVLEAWRALSGRIDEATMVALNARVKLDGTPEGQAASDFIQATFGGATGFVATSRAARLWSRAREHLWLVFVSLLAAMVVGIPLGLWAAKRRRAGRLILAIVGVVQTIPSLALLVFMIPLLGIGTGPAVAALFLYSLLPIVRNTHHGVTGIAADLRDSARSLGLSAWATLVRIELPLASASIIAGIKTSAVINVGTATLGALIGAGGFGQPILTGIRLADVGLILEGAVPAAVLALIVQWLFDGTERLIVPKGLRLQRGR